jgi:hypothetical protein
MIWILLKMGSTGCPATSGQDLLHGVSNCVSQTIQVTGGHTYFEVFVLVSRDLSGCGNYGG